jgi:hypothetical protein
MYERSSIVNTNFLTVIKKIVAEQGESILAEPQRLKGWISDYAKDEPKAERLAFGRCIEYDAYGELKNAPAGGRAIVKGRLAQRLHHEEGLDEALCTGALDLLEAAVWGTNEPAKDTQASAPYMQTSASGSPGAEHRPHSIESPAASMPESSVSPADDASKVNPATTPADKETWSFVIAFVIAFVIGLSIFIYLLVVGIIPDDLPEIVVGGIFLVGIVVLSCIVYPIVAKVMGVGKD